MSARMVTSAALAGASIGANLTMLVTRSPSVLVWVASVALLVASIILRPSPEHRRTR